MKTLLTILVTSVALLTGVSLAYAQVPQKFNYQAVCRDNSGNVLADQPVVLLMTIRQSFPGGTILYKETHSVVTNNFGLVNIAIGGGMVVLGVFSDIPWGSGDKYLEIEIDAGSGFHSIGTTQLLSVPYALFAGTAESVSEEKHYVGELYGGGVVFWVDHTGQHGLIINMIDLSVTQVWSNVTTAYIETTNDWDGLTNTSNIVGQFGHTASAAQLCIEYINLDYGTGVYSDWYLPSISELNHVWNNLFEVQKALTIDGNAATTTLSTNNSCWSSTEYNGNYAWYFSFRSGDPDYYNKGYATRVRAVRAF